MDNDATNEMPNKSRPTSAAVKELNVTKCPGNQSRNYNHPLSVFIPIHITVAEAGALAGVEATRGLGA